MKTIQILDPFCSIFQTAKQNTSSARTHTYTANYSMLDVIKCYEVWTYEIQSIWLQPVVLVAAVVVVAVAVVVAFDDDDARDQLKNKQNSKHNTRRTHRGTGQGRYC